jgi:hypothetical protein
VAAEDARRAVAHGTETPAAGQSMSEEEVPWVVMIVGQSGQGVVECVAMQRLEHLDAARRARVESAIQISLLLEDLGRESLHPSVAVESLGGFCNFARLGTVCWMEARFHPPFTS